jgi:serine/threonine protein kinase
MPADLKRVKEIFLAAAEMAGPAEREALLREACGGDAALRRQVETLLSKHDKAWSFLEPPSPDPAAMGPHLGEREPLALPGSPRSADEAAGWQIGPYRLEQKLGEGGMGAVWVAEQAEPVKRRVALKLIKPGMDSVQIVRSFEAERQALALMDHHNIARILDDGAVEGSPADTGGRAGRPYFVMELVRGVPITRYCDELQLSVRERLELFVPVCQAIQHAHTKAVIHRDVKPSNVLVAVLDGKPAAKVIDFGIAKALHHPLTDASLHTEFGAVVGTLEYMSPEQAELSALDVDTRADVYALGVMLYELLTGTTPLDCKRLARAGYSELLRRIREEEPPRPSSRLSESKETLAGLAELRRSEPARLTRAVRGELDWIAMKCLEKDRTRRYESAGGLAEDVQRYLNDEPVQACPPSAWYRLSKNPRTMLQAAPFGAVNKRGRADPIYDPHVLAPHLHAPHQGADDFPTRQPVRLLQPRADARRELFQPTQHQPQLLSGRLRVRQRSDF